VSINNIISTPVVPIKSSVTHFTANIAGGYTYVTDMWTLDGVTVATNTHNSFNYTFNQTGEYLLGYRLRTTYDGIYDLSQTFYVAVASGNPVSLLSANGPVINYNVPTGYDEITVNMYGGCGGGGGGAYNVYGGGGGASSANITGTLVMGPGYIVNAEAGSGGIGSSGSGSDGTTTSVIITGSVTSGGDTYSLYSVGGGGGGGGTGQAPGAGGKKGKGVSPPNPFITNAPASDGGYGGFQMPVDNGAYVGGDLSGILHGGNGSLSSGGENGSDGYFSIQIRKLPPPTIKSMTMSTLTPYVGESVTFTPEISGTYFAVSDAWFINGIRQGGSQHISSPSFSKSFDTYGRYDISYSLTSTNNTVVYTKTIYVVGEYGDPIVLDISGLSASNIYNFTPGVEYLQAQISILGGSGGGGGSGIPSNGGGGGGAAYIRGTYFAGDASGIVVNLTQGSRGLGGSQVTQGNTSGSDGTSGTSTVLSIRGKNPITLIANGGGKGGGGSSNQGTAGIGGSTTSVPSGFTCTAGSTANLNNAGNDGDGVPRAGKGGKSGAGGNGRYGSYTLTFTFPPPPTVTIKLNPNQPIVGQSTKITPDISGYYIGVSDAWGFVSGVDISSGPYVGSPINYTFQDYGTYNMYYTLNTTNATIQTPFTVAIPESINPPTFKLNGTALATTNELLYDTSYNIVATVTGNYTPLSYGWKVRDIKTTESGTTFGTVMNLIGQNSLTNHFIINISNSIPLNASSGVSNDYNVFQVPINIQFTLATALEVHVYDISYVEFSLNLYPDTATYTLNCQTTVYPSTLVPVSLTSTYSSFDLSGYLCSTSLNNPSSQYIYISTITAGTPYQLDTNTSGLFSIPIPPNLGSRTVLTAYIDTYYTQIARTIYNMATLPHSADSAAITEVFPAVIDPIHMIVPNAIYINDPTQFIADISLNTMGGPGGGVKAGSLPGAVGTWALGGLDPDNLSGPYERYVTYTLTNTNSYNLAYTLTLGDKSIQNPVHGNIDIAAVPAPPITYISNINPLPNNYAVPPRYNTITYTLIGGGGAGNYGSAGSAVSVGGSGGSGGGNGEKVEGEVTIASGTVLLITVGTGGVLGGSNGGATMIVTTNNYTIASAAGGYNGAGNPGDLNYGIDGGVGGSGLDGTSVSTPSITGIYGAGGGGGGGGGAGGSSGIPGGSRGGRGGQPGAQSAPRSAQVGSYGSNGFSSPGAGGQGGLGGVGFYIITLSYVENPSI